MNFLEDLFSGQMHDIFQIQGFSTTIIQDMTRGMLWSWLLMFYFWRMHDLQNLCMESHQEIFADVITELILNVPLVIYNIIYYQDQALC